jgi:nitrilase
MVSTGDVQENLRAADRLIALAVQGGAGLVLLPENFAVLDCGPLREFAEVEDDPQGPLQGFLASQAARHGILLVGGTVPLLSRPLQPGDAEPQRLTDGRVRPACLVYDADGNRIARYDKIHLFDVRVGDRQAEYSESKSFEPGELVETVDTPAGRLGLSICYDVRFPELYRRLAEAGADIVTVPSAFTRATGAAHWEVLLRARAIETQCYIVAANQGGVHNARRETFGHSMIIDPWGRVIDCLAEGEGVVFGDTDPALISRVRSDMPIASHRRL